MVLLPLTLKAAVEAVVFLTLSLLRSLFRHKRTVALFLGRFSLSPLPFRLLLSSPSLPPVQNTVVA